MYRTHAPLYQRPADSRCVELRALKKQFRSTARTVYQLDFFPNGPKHVGESDTVSVLLPGVEIRPADVFCSSASASLQGFHQQTCK